VVIKIGTSGWIYKHWRDIFYPPDASGRELEFYARHFQTVEINYSFYRLPGRHVFEDWAGRVPDEFLFAVKASRFLTHMRKLREPAEPIERLLDASAGLGPKRGPILFQFPKRWHRNLDRLREFLPILPVGPRYAFEFRNDEWLDDSVLTALERHGCALCIPIAPDIPHTKRLTASFTYLRFHYGTAGSNVEGETLRTWARWAQKANGDGVDAYVYFNNDMEGCAIENARQFDAYCR
jgi:uncharacterized protein YecE (DUF72 family)